MELVSAYLYIKIPVPVNDLHASTLHNLKRNGWYTDKTNAKFTMLNKRIQSGDTWYRTLVRFEHKGDSLSLSVPCPFLITECEPIEGTETARWKDIKVHHGLKLGVSGYLQQGVPSAVIDEVYQDFKTYTDYN